MLSAPSPNDPDDDPKRITRTKTSTRVGAHSAAEDEDDGEGGRGAASPDRWRWVPRIFAAVAGIAAVVLAAGTVWFSHGVWWGKDGTSAAATQKVRQQVLATAISCFGAITSYDYRTLAASEAAGVACTTGVFQSDYKKTMETTVKTLAPESKTVQVYQADKAGIVSVSPNGKQFVVLLYGQQQVTNSTTGTSSPQLEILSGRMTLDEVGGRWLVSALQQA